MLHDPATLPALAPEVEEHLTANAVDDQSRYMARKYFKDWGKVSPHLDGNFINSWQGLFMHARGEEQGVAHNARIEDLTSKTERRKARAAREQFGAEWLAWQEQCAARNAWIERLNAEWRKRVGEAKANKAQWDAYVEAARLEFQAAKNTSTPVQPKR